MDNATNPLPPGETAGLNAQTGEQWERLCRFDDVPDGEGIAVTPRDRSLAVWRVSENVFVTDDTCSHGEASLAKDGMLDGYAVVCGLHQGEFDIRTGAVLAAPCNRPIHSYAACVKDGWVLAKIGS